MNIIPIIKTSSTHGNQIRDNTHNQDQERTSNNFKVMNTIVNIPTKNPLPLDEDDDTVFKIRSFNYLIMFSNTHS